MLLSFPVRKKGTLRYYQSLADAFDDTLGNSLSDELKRTVQEVTHLSGFLNCYDNIVPKFVDDLLK